ncbi:isochorismatase family protein [Halobacillus dabanensis]|uniref:isochorismatase family protein n=1 Tax=Halobacillus dabanensis TaxID=240302 RepID=UPI001FC9F8F0|nr:isochorismatase family protein [Halobacillus dabanensis]
MIEKKTPSSFYQTSLDDFLTEAGVDQIFITGLNSEYCGLFPSIAGFDLGGTRSR